MKHQRPYAVLGQWGGRLARRASPSRLAFTLTELIAVITIIVILLAVSIPAFRSTIASAESSNAETQLRLAFVSAHNAALHSERGADTAVVFTYEPGGRTTALICEYAGTFKDTTNGPANGVYRDVFVPLPNFEPVQLAQGWMVRGLVPAGTLNLGAGAQGRDWYEDLPARAIDADTRNWVFPETEFYDALSRSDGADRQSFMVRFNGGIGSVALGDSREALVLSPRPTAAGRTEQPPFDEYRVDIGADVAATVRTALRRDDWQGLFGGNTNPLSQLFGDGSGDTILCRTVEQIVLYKATDLANGIGAKLNRDTGCFYAAIDDRNKEPKYDIRPRGALDRITPWLEGDTNYNEDWLDEDDIPVARIYTVQRYTGALQPVPLLDYSGVRP